jgi:hypothetical protein
MAKDNDLKKNFKSYYESVILNEVVKDIEFDENGNQIPSGTGKMPSAEIIKANKERSKSNQETYEFDGTTITSGPYAAGDEEFEQEEEEEDDDDNETDDEGEVISREIIGSYPVGAAGKYEFDGTSITAGPVVEKNNISKFLKHLSEKNYSSAHKYLKAVLEDKFKKNISNRIK